jgi:ABC-type multidrug transport system permease subunit
MYGNGWGSNEQSINNRRLPAVSPPSPPSPPIGLWVYIFGALTLACLAGVGTDLAASLAKGSSDSDRAQLTIPSLAISAIVWVAGAAYAGVKGGSSAISEVLVLCVGSVSSIALTAHSLSQGGGVVKTNRDSQKAVFLGVCVLAAVTTLTLLSKHKGMQKDGSEVLFYIGSVLLFLITGVALSFYSWASFCDCQEDAKRVRRVSTIGFMVLFVLILLLIVSRFFMRNYSVLKTYAMTSAASTLLVFMILSSEVDFGAVL